MYTAQHWLGADRIAKINDPAILSRMAGFFRFHFRSIIFGLHLLDVQATISSELGKDSHRHPSTKGRFAMRKLTAEFKGGISCLALSSDDRWLAANQLVGPGGKELKQPIRLWDLHDLDRPAENMAGREPHVMAFSPDGQFLAYTGNSNGVTLQPLPGTAKPTRVLSTVSTRSFLFIPYSTQILVWANSPCGYDLKTKKKFAVTLEGLDFDAKDPQGRHHATLQTMLMRPDGGALVARVLENTFDPRNEDAFESVVTLQRWTYPACSNRVKSASIPLDSVFGKPAVTQLAYSPNGRFLAGRRAHDVVIFDADTLTEITTLTPSGVRDKFRPKDPSVLSLAFTQDGKRLAVGCAGQNNAANVSFFSTADWKKEPDVKCPCDRVRELAFTKNGRLIAVADATPVVWEVGDY